MKIRSLNRNQPPICLGVPILTETLINELLSLHRRYAKAVIAIRNLTAFTALAILGLGCAPSTEQLIRDAHATGNWSQVEQRLEADAKRQARLATLECEDDLVSLCTRSLMTTKLECICVKNATARSAAGLPPF